AGKPVIWINAVADTPPVFIKPANEETPVTEELLEQAVNFIVGPPPREEIEHAFAGPSTHALFAYRTFSDERPHAFNWGS
ncbi:hypothetical protein DF186_23720, partial [Enterococcus hirae]